MTKVVICTIKSWNIKYAEEYKKNSADDIYIIKEKNELTVEKMDLLNPDYIFFPHWSYYIPKEIFTKYNCIVFHITDLPYGRGGSPLQNLIERGHSNTMISAIQVTEAIDGGSIYCKKPLDLHGSASEIFLRASGIIFDEMIPKILRDKIQPIPQEGEVVEFKRRTPEQSELTEDMTLDKIYDYVRMLDAEGYPNAFLKFGKYKLLFSRAQRCTDSLLCDVRIIEEDNHE